MKLIDILAAIAVLSLIVSLPNAAYAHNGLVHDGCAAGQVFTAGDLTISGAYARAMLPQAKVGGGYLAISNAGTEPDRLLGGKSEAAKRVGVHSMSMEGDVMKMSEAEGGIEIPAGETVNLAPGGLHVMFNGIKVPFKEGECLQLTLAFEKAGDVPVILPIGGVSAEAAPEGHAH